MRFQLRANLLAIALGLAGGALFSLFNWPLPWLLGALVFTLTASFAGLQLTLDTGIRNPALMVLGVAVGAAFTPNFLDHAKDWWLSLTGIALFVVIASPLAILYCRRVMGFDITSATFAGMPGGLSEMILTGTAQGGDARYIALVHTGRLAIVLILIAPAMQIIGGMEFTVVRAEINSWTTLPLLDALVLLCCAFFGTIIAKIIRLPNPFLLGPLLLSACAHLLDITAASPPFWLLNVVQLLVGTYIGSQFAGLRLGEMLRTLTLSTLLTFALLGLAGLFAWLLSRSVGLPFATVLLAFVPGGIAEMCLIAVLLQIDPIFVAAHHLFRVLLVLFSSPLLVTWIQRRKSLLSRCNSGPTGG